MRSLRAVGLGVGLAACAHAPGGAGSSTSPVPTSPSLASAAGGAPHASPSVATPAGTLTASQARRYMLQLINRDRATAGLAPVQLDDGAAQHAGQAHAEDMAKNGFLGHWGTDGSIPEQRYTDAGGTDVVFENASCFTDEHKRTLDSSARIDPASVEHTEDMFFHEQPPNDGHRLNILKPWHVRVGIGLAQPVATATEIPVPCFSQEFVDDYGTYAAVPRNLRVGATLHVAGTIAPQATFAGVGLTRVDAPKPLPVDELNRRRHYPIPSPYQMYWPPGFQTPIPVQVSGSHFSVDVPVSDGGKAGLYEVSVWATFPGSPDPAMVSLRTFSANR